MQERWYGHSYLVCSGTRTGIGIAPAFVAPGPMVNWILHTSIRRYDPLDYQLMILPVLVLQAAKLSIVPSSCTNAEFVPVLPFDILAHTLP
jgi:hypothetical protein